jgi:hypothetical protein
VRCPLLAFRGRVLHNRACLRSVVRGTQITRAPRHICALAKNGLTHILSSSFFWVFGCPRSIVEWLPGERATPAGWSTAAIERRWSRRTSVFLFLLCTVNQRLPRSLPECPLLALSGHERRLGECPLSGVKRTSVNPSQMSAFDPKRTCSSFMRIWLTGSGDYLAAALRPSPRHVPASRNAGQ